MILKIIVGALLALPFAVSAANPSVESFIQSTTGMTSGGIASFSWRMAAAGGYSFLIPCVQGIKLKRTDGTAFECNTKISSTATALGGIDLLIYNISGITKTVTMRAIPKDATGTDYDLGRQDLSISVATAPEPIATFTGATSTASFVAYPIAWSSSLIDGTNLSFPCSSNIQASSTSYAQVYLPCGKPIFTTDLAGSGALTLYFSNSSPSAETVTLTLYPAMSAGAYDGIHTKTLEVLVRSNVVPEPTLTSFLTSATTNTAGSDMPIVFTWATENALNANMQLPCNDAITTTTLINNATTTLRCGSTALNTPLGENGTITLYFANKSNTDQQQSITLLPGRIAGGFDGTRAKTINLSIASKDTPVSSLQTPASLSTTTTTTPTTTTTTTSVAIPLGCAGANRYNSTTGQPCPIANSTTKTKIYGKKFLVNLRRGMKHTDVRSLQEFLKNDSTIYPEGIISGVFGPATERAVGRFQAKNNIVRSGQPGYGAIGPKTRSFLNSLTQ